MRAETDERDLPRSPLNLLPLELRHRRWSTYDVSMVDMDGGRQRVSSQMPTDHHACNILCCMPYAWKKSLGIAVIWAYSDSIRNMFVGVFFGSASIAKKEQTHDSSSCCHAGWCDSTSKKHLRPVRLEKREQTHGINSCGLDDDFKSTTKQTPAAPTKTEPPKERSACGQ